MSDLSQLLLESCKKMNVCLNDKQLKQFMDYKDMILEWNEKINLTAITDEREIILKHFVDCISVCGEIDLGTEKVIDVGTGAGFPGVPLKIACPSIRITLMDSLNKRICFLNELVNRLGLENAECIHMRAEDGGSDISFRENYDLCVSRAVANLSVLSEYCLPFIKIGGTFIAMKGPSAEAELETGRKAIKILGGEVSDIKEIAIPETNIYHKLIIIKKVKRTDKKYPRTAAKIKKAQL
ncbi:ribosomal RNA small subunit methyltransferase G [Clostridiales bacterium]|nr:ribosomal RNA small subunit methyltransferase G [Clostridiales bacterium]